MTKEAKIMALIELSMQESTQVNWCIKASDVVRLAGHKLCDDVLAGKTIRHKGSLGPDGWAFEDVLDAYTAEKEKVIVNGVEINAPLRVAPKVGKIVYHVTGVGVTCYAWNNREFDNDRIPFGKVHDNEADAVAHFEAQQKPFEGWAK